MVHILTKTWLQYGPQQAGPEGPVQTWKADCHVFDSDTRTASFAPNYLTYYQTFYGFPIGDDPAPQDYSRPTSEEFYVYVNGSTRIGYFHDGQGGVTTVGSALEVVATVTSCACYGTNTGDITLAVSGQDGPFTYLWADGPTTRDRTALVAGTYTVTVTDTPTGTVATKVIQVGQNRRIDVLVKKTGSDVRLEVSGGVAPYTYAWSDGATTAERLNLAAGAYTVTVTDLLGCTQLAAFSIDGYRYYFSGNPITLSLDAGEDYRLDPSTKAGLTFLCEVWLEPEFGSNTFVQIGTVLEQPADVAGRTVFQVEELLDAYLDYHVPAVGQDYVSLAAPVFRRFYLKYAENFGTPPQRAATTVLQQHVVLRGGLSRVEHALQSYQERFRPAVRPFLTWQPNNPLVPADQLVFLYYFVDDADLAEFQLRVRVHYDDGTDTAFTAATQAGVQRYQVYCLPAGHAQFDLQDEPDRRVVGWDVWVADADAGIRSEVRRYRLDRRPAAQRRYLLYSNSLGGMDVAAFTGEAQLDAEVSGDEVERAPEPFADPLLGDQLVLDRTLRPVLKLASGLRPYSREWTAALQELLLARRVLLLTGPRWQPGVVKAQTTPIRQDGNPIQTVDLVLQLPRERFYTPRLGASPVTRQDLLLP